MAFTDNVYDGDTLLPQLEQTQRVTDHKPKVGIADRGYKGRKAVNGVQIVIPAKLQFHVSPGERNPIEGKLGQAKTGYGLNRIKARLKGTSES